MNIITLIGDWKLKDPYVGILKGQLYASIPDIAIIDISHAISPFNIEQTYFILKNSYSKFPPYSLHIILTATSFSRTASPVLVQMNNHFFLGEDTGIFSLLSKNENYSAYLFEDNAIASLDFTEKLVFIASAFFNNTYLSFSSPCLSFKKKWLVEPNYSPSENKLRGRIMYIDSCYNAITDIPNRLFLEVKGDRPFKAYVLQKHIQITHYHDYYVSNDGEIYLVNNRLGFLEITMFQGNISTLADFHEGDKVEIDFM